MRRCYSGVTPSLVRATAARGLAAAPPWRPFGRTVPVAALIDPLLLAAAPRSSLSAVVRRFAFGFSHETRRRALGANPPPPGALAEGLVGAPHGLEWLAEWLKGRHPAQRRIPLPRPL